MQWVVDLVVLRFGVLVIGLLVRGVGFGGAFGVLLWCACFGLVIWVVGTCLCY